MSASRAVGDGGRARGDGVNFDTGDGDLGNGGTSEESSDGE